MHHRGFVALISIILISVVLSIVVLEISASQFAAQNYLQQSINKEQSYYIAQSCMEIALFKHKEDSHYNGDTTHIVGSYICTILPFRHENTLIIITTYAEVESAQTTLTKTIQ